MKFLHEDTLCTCEHVLAGEPAHVGFRQCGGLVCSANCWIHFKAPGRFARNLESKQRVAQPCVLPVVLPTASVSANKEILIPVSTACVLSVQLDSAYPWRC